MWGLRVHEKILNQVQSCFKKTIISEYNRMKIFSIPRFTVYSQNDFLTGFRTTLLGLPLIAYYGDQSKVFKYTWTNVQNHSLHTRILCINGRVG